MPPHAPLFTPFATHPETLAITPELVTRYALPRWAANFALGTAGYRDLLDPDDLFNPEVPFNGVTIAILLTARAQLALEHGLAQLHVGGEVRPHTQEFIDLAARIYAAHGITVHLRPQGERTTPIWLSSFGVFHDELDGGENFTASHSQSYKGGWKPMDAAGGQLLAMAGLIADRVRALVQQAQTGGMTIELAAADDARIRRDFDPVTPYVRALEQVVPRELIAEIPAAAAAGFRATFCTEGGSMAATAGRVFAELDLAMAPDGAISFTHAEEDENYHGIGVVDGVNYGVDPGKWQIYKHVGAQAMLRENTCHIFFIWDPDGDRFNMVTPAPVEVADAAAAAGLEVEPLDATRCVVYFKPNQIYFMLTGVRLDALAANGELEDHDWIVATTYPTSRSIGELAEAYAERHDVSLATFRTPVGFKHFAALVGNLEDQLADDTDPCTATDVTGETTAFGADPRLLIMAEESGGAAMGPGEPMACRGGEQTSLAPKEKDGMQIGVLALGLAARLHREGGSFASYYLHLLETYDIGWRFYERRDVTLFDESLQGDARAAAQAAGNRRKHATVAFFANLEDRKPQDVVDTLQSRLPAGTTLPSVQRCFHAGDGTLIEMDGVWFELRASGTDAVLRYYLEGRDRAGVSALNEAFTNLRIDEA